LKSLKCNEIVKAVAKLICKYKDDLYQSLGVELAEFAVFCARFQEEENGKNGWGIFFSNCCWTRTLWIHFLMWR